MSQDQITGLIIMGEMICWLAAAVAVVGIITWYLVVTGRVDRP